MSDSTLWHCLECPCNVGFRYTSTITFGQHFKSHRHQLYEFRHKDRKQRITIGHLETRNVQLHHQLLKMKQTKDILQTQYANVNNRLSQECQKTRMLTDLVDEVRQEKKDENRRDRLVMMYVWRIWITKCQLSQVRQHSYRTYFDQCLKHLLHMYQFKRALRRCHDIIERYESH